MNEHKHDKNYDATRDTPDTAEGGAHTPVADKSSRPNPPHTTKGGITAPKFGSAGSGGAELEPGPERD
jgi:hypothetical protein